MESISSRCASVDSNVILRLILRDNPEQVTRVLEMMLNGSDYYVDDAAIAESIYVLTKSHMIRPKIVENIQLILMNPMFIYDKPFFDPVFETYLTHPSLSFDDCVLAARAEKKGYTPLYTFDRKLANQSPAAELIH